MSRFVHILFHGAMIVSQVALATGKFIPPPYNIAAIGGGAAFQGIVAVVQEKRAAKKAAGGK
jgi:hypothetical protein